MGLTASQQSVKQSDEILVDLKTLIFSTDRIVTDFTKV